MKYIIKGISEAINECDCCGRTDLKKTVGIEINGKLGYYGVICASHLIKIETKRLNEEIKIHEKQQIKDDIKKQDKEKEDWKHFIFTETGESDLTLGFKKLGGLGKAYDLFKNKLNNTCI